MGGKHGLDECNGLQSLRSPQTRPRNHRTTGSSSFSCSSRYHPAAAMHAGNSRSPYPGGPNRRDSLQNALAPRRHFSGAALSVPPRRAHSPYRSDPGSDGFLPTPASRHFLQTRLSCWKAAATRAPRNRLSPASANERQGGLDRTPDWLAVGQKEAPRLVKGRRQGGKASCGRQGLAEETGIFSLRW